VEKLLWGNVVRLLDGGGKEWRSRGGGGEVGGDKRRRVGCCSAVDGLAMGGWRIRGRRRRSHAGFDVVRGCLRW